MQSIREQLLDELDKLTPEQQEYMLHIARQLQRSTPIGTPGEVLLAHMDSFQFEPGELDAMMSAIEEGCERIDWDGWQ